MLSFIRFSSSVSRVVRKFNKKGKGNRPSSKFGPNPGMDRSLGVLRKENIPIDEEAYGDILEDRAFNPYDLHNVHKEYESEERIQREKLSSAIIKRKYFPEVKLPNLLTWSEKEHIRYLHNEDPEEWTPEKLAESFPVTVEVAKKILKATWKPATPTRIDRHDAGAVRNWKELKEGTLENVTPELRERFLKFSDRVIPPRREQDVEKTNELMASLQVFGEYSSIVASRQKVSENENSPTTIEELQQKRLSIDHPRDDVESYYKNKNEKITLSKLKSNLRKTVEDDKPISKMEELILKSREETLVDNFYAKSSPTETSLDPKTVERSADIFGNLDEIESPRADREYHLRIRIPKSLYQKGMTYRISDCYYDDDGRFLYRVPGLTGQFEN